MSEVNVARQQFKKLEEKDVLEHADDVYAKDYVPKKHDKSSAEYGTPKSGTLSEMRGKQAGKLMMMNQIFRDFSPGCGKRNGPTLRSDRPLR